MTEAVRLVLAAILCAVSALSFDCSRVAGADSLGTFVQFKTGYVMNLLYCVNYIAQHEGKRYIYNDFLQKHKLSDREVSWLQGYKDCFGDSDKYADYVRLEGIALKSKDLDEFERNVVVAFKPASARAAVRAVSAFDPDFRKLVWSSVSVEAEERRVEIDGLCRDSLSPDLMRVRKMVASDWPQSRGIDFEIVVVPRESEDSSGRDAHATGLWDDGHCVIEVMSGRDVREYLGTVFHELCHLMLTSRPAAVEDAQHKYFLQDNGKRAYDVLMEALPTALGSGWYSTKVTGKPAKYWYGNEVINRYAHAMQPLCEKYLSDGRVIDRAFAQEACATFRREKFDSKP